MKRFTNLFFILVGFTFSLVSLNASAKTPAYKIEVIVFESLALKGWTEEYWPEDNQLLHALQFACYPGRSVFCQSFYPGDHRW